MNFQLKQTFQTPDGATFDTKEAAMRHMRKDAIMAALAAVCGGDRTLAVAIYDKEEELTAAFDTGTIRMVTKAERKQLEKALDALKAAAPAGCEFLVNNVDAIAASFRWPAQKRLTAEEKLQAQHVAVTELFEGRTDVANWVLQEKDKIMAAFKAGQPERKVPESAAAGLAAWQAMKSAEKALKLAHEALEKGEGSPEAVAEAQANFDAAKKVVDDRKKAAQAAADAQ